MSCPPNDVIAKLLVCDGETCGEPSHRLQWRTDLNPQRYRHVTGDGVFTAAQCKRVDLGGGQYTWELEVAHWDGTTCAGTWVFRRLTAADDPLGSYGYWDGNTVDADLASATVEPVME